MGYYGNGFVFTSEPSWQALGRLPREVGLTGYRHKKREVWLLDAWTCRRSGEHWPFTIELDGTRIAAPRLAAIEKTLKRICDAVGDMPDTASYLRAAAYVSKLLGIETFFFAADDDGTDLAALANGGTLSQFRVCLPGCTVDYRDAAFAVTPHLSEDDESDPEEVVETLTAIRDVRVLKPLDISDGLPMYGSPTALWPKAAGDPEKMLGIGTFDPFVNLERDFREVFSRPCGR